MQLDLHLLLDYILGTAVHIENCWLIVLSEGVFQVVRDEAGLANRSITDKDQLDILDAFLAILPLDFRILRWPWLLH